MFWMAATRGGKLENRHEGFGVVSSTSGTLLHCTPQGRECATFFRSAAKPFQAIPLILDLMDQTLSQPRSELSRWAPRISAATARRARTRDRPGSRAAGARRRLASRSQRGHVARLPHRALVELGAGGDLLLGGAGDDKLVGGDGNDVITGNALNNRFTGGLGADVMDGAGGIDTLEETADEDFVLKDSLL